jgi:hypothetical protein
VTECVLREALFPAFSQFARAHPTDELEHEFTRRARVKNPVWVAGRLRQIECRDIGANSKHARFVHAQSIECQELAPHLDLIGKRDTRALLAERGRAATSGRGAGRRRGSSIARRSHPVPPVDPRRLQGPMCVPAPTAGREADSLRVLHRKPMPFDRRCARVSDGDGISVQLTGVLSHGIDSQ